MINATTAITKKIVGSFAPASPLTCSEWAEQHRIMTAFDSPAAGQHYSFERSPYSKEILDFYSNPRIRMIVMKWATQSGKTNNIMNMIGWTMSEAPGPILLAVPTINSVEKFSSTRIDPMVKASPALRTLPLAKWVLREKHFKGGVLYLGSSQSSADLSSSSICSVFADELKDWVGLSSVGGTDPVRYLIDRTKTFPYTKKIVLISSPTTADGPISKYFNTCEAKIYYHVPCPHCGELFQFKFEQIKFGEENFEFDVTDKSTPQYWAEAKKHSYYECEFCNKKITDIMKPKMLKAGCWLQADKSAIPAGVESIGSELSSMYSLDLKFGDFSAEFLEARLDRSKLMNFKTAWLGQEWLEDTVTVSASSLQKHICNLEPCIVPESAVCLTCGIDVQGNRFYYTVYAWDKLNNSWLIHYGLLTSFDEVRSLVFNNEYPIAGSDKTMKIWRAGIDTGGGINQRDDDTFSQTETIYNFVRQHSQGKIFALKGRGGKGDGTRVKLSLLDKYPSGKVMVGGLSLYHLDVDAFKETFFWRLDQDEADSQQVWFHKGCENSLFNSLTAEEKVRNKNGQWEWKKIRSRNDFLDCSVYAMALVDNQFAGGLKILGNKKMGIPELPPDVYPEHKVNDYMKSVQQRTNGGWLKRKR